MVLRPSEDPTGREGVEGSLWPLTIGGYWELDSEMADLAWIDGCFLTYMLTVILDLVARLRPLRFSLIGIQLLYFCSLLNS